MLIAFFLVGVLEVLSPCKSGFDISLSRGDHVTVFLSMFYTLLLKVDVAGERDQSQAASAGVFEAGHVVMILASVVEAVASATHPGTRVLATKRGLPNCSH